MLSYFGRAWARIGVLWALGLMAVCGASMSAAAAQVPVAEDPTALMVSAAKLNGLVDDEMKPWHLKASFQLLDENGASKDQGTIEEFWAGAHKNRVIYTINRLTQTMYETEKGGMQSGTAGQISNLVLQAQAGLVQPLPDVGIIQHQGFELHEKDAGGAKLRTLAAKGAPGSISYPGFVGVTYFLDTDKPVLRVLATGRGAIEVVRNKVVIFQGRYVPEEIVIAHSGKVALRAQVDKIESLATVDEAEFTPPANAVALPKTINVSADFAKGLLVKKELPDYPMAALQERIQGTVVLQATIGTDGHVKGLRVIVGPWELQQAAMDAVRKWVYKPYLLNGEAVEVNTTINVVFSLG
ncbi:energy transducer TonB [Acidicapsa ligni]|uniref:energy transducer TonB n=1 Tax=Acidicapsa ligni TaxID=542300 RepID=UPI0021DFF283|nr:energy transducer TonB [Acidicapsa ligni]